MRKSLSAVLAALLVLVVVSGCTQVRYVDMNEGEGTVKGTPISTYDELVKAAAGYGDYYLTKDIPLEDQISITGEITLNGNGYTLSRNGYAADHTNGNLYGAVLLIQSDNVAIKNITIDGLNTKTPETNPDDYWDNGEYAIKAYGSETDQLTGIVLEDIEIISSNAGMLVRGAAVTLKGEAVLRDVEFGGFAVDSKDDSSFDCDLDVTDCRFKGDISRTVPAIWTEHVDNEKEKVTGWEKAGLEELKNVGNGSQTYYVK